MKVAARIGERLRREIGREAEVPAAAVIPAPIAYIKVVAVKTLVVGFRGGPTGLPMGMHWPARPSTRRPRLLLTERARETGLLL